MNTLKDTLIDPLPPVAEFDRAHAHQVFETFARQDGAQLSTLGVEQHLALDLDAALADDPVSGHRAMAIVEVPRGDEEEDKGYFILGHHHDHGYYLAGPNSDIEMLDRFQARYAIDIDKLPIQLGKEAGAEITIGRSGISFDDGSGESFSVSESLLESTMNEFGSNTSRKHATFTVTEEGVVVTNHSRNGLRVVSKK